MSPQVLVQSPIHPPSITKSTNQLSPSCSTPQHTRGQRSSVKVDHGPCPDHANRPTSLCHCFCIDGVTVDLLYIYSGPFVPPTGVRPGALTTRLYGCKISVLWTCKASIVYMLGCHCVLRSHACNITYKGAPHTDYIAVCCCFVPWIGFL